jgi:hypothetical protein
MIRNKIVRSKRKKQDKNLRADKYGIVSCS